MKRFYKSLVPKLAAVVLLLAFYSLTLLPKLSFKERQQLGRDFHFAELPMFEPKAIQPKFVRNVHPQYKNISAWISSVGAAITITDLDGNGLCNDLIHVDPRFDQVLISAAEGTLSTYAPFELAPRKVSYDPRTMAPMGSLAHDFNEDGKTDVLVYYWGRTPIIFYQAEGSFIERELSPVMERWFTNAATLEDFDGDGHTDILISNYFPDGAKILDADATDNEQTMQHSMSRAWNGGDNHFFLYSVNGGGASQYFEHEEWKEGIDHPTDWTLAVAAADIDGDLLPEIYFANDFGPDKILYNLSSPGRLHFKQLKGKRNFDDIRSSVLGKDSFKGMGACFADINGDGLLDIYVSNIAARYALEESHFAFINTGEFSKMKDGIAPFHNESEKLGLSRSSWGWESKIADFNNDGVVEALQAVGFIKGKYDRWPELQELAIGNDELLSNPSVWPDFTPGADLSGHSHNPFFVQSQNGRFFDLAKEVGLGRINVCRGIAISDVDHDGDQDFVFANQWEPSFLYRNSYSGKNKFLGLRLMLNPSIKDSVLTQPVQSNQLRFAIGASAKLILENKTVPAFVDGGNGHSGKNSNEIFFGLGDIKPDQKFKLELKWRNRRGQVLSNTIELSAGWHTINLPY